MGRSGPPSLRSRIALALGAAALFGLSTPAAKRLVALSDPWLLAGLLYLGSGLGLGVLQLARRIWRGREAGEARLGRQDWPWLGAAILLGGCVGPVLLMFGLRYGTASDAALLLNLEAVFTALLAWFVFREHFDTRIALGMVAIVAGAAVLAWDGSQTFRPSAAALMVSGACLAWALDNNLTRKVAARDPVQIAGLKGALAGAVNVGLALSLGASLPPLGGVLAAAIVGFLGYGVSLALFVLALRHLGAGRTGAYFSTAPFVGVAASIVVLNEPVTSRLGVAATLMGVGVWLHVSERHEHQHVHERLAHEHSHWHDEHHQHEHPPQVPAREPHTHWHVHEPLRHGHPHYPDIHHRHHH